MLVKSKREIISMGAAHCGAVKPTERTGKRLAPEELKRWLDEGKPCVLLDTRNDYEVRNRRRGEIERERRPPIRPPDLRYPLTCPCLVSRWTTGCGTSALAAPLHPFSSGWAPSRPP